jgi:hypothetical protein
LERGWQLDGDLAIPRSSPQNEFFIEAAANSNIHYGFSCKPVAFASELDTVARARNNAPHE